MAKRKADEASKGQRSAFATLKPDHSRPANLTSASQNLETSNPRKRIKAKSNAELRTPKPFSGYWGQASPPASSQSIPQLDITVENAILYDNEDVDSQEGDKFDSSDSDAITTSINPTQLLSTFDPATSSVLEETENIWTICLTHTDTLTLIGQYDLWVRRGAIKILGAVIYRGFQAFRVYAPSTHSLPTITASQDPFGQVHEFVEIVIVSSSSRIRMLRLASPKFGRIWNHQQVWKKETKSFLDLSRRSFTFLKSSTDDKYQRPLRLLDPPADWNSMIDQLQASQPGRPQTVMVCGPKGSGKSTFCRILVNSLLSVKPPPPPQRLSKMFQSKAQADNEGVFFLDLDPGQPEFSPPGEISLVHLRSYNLGVPYTHPMVNHSEGSRMVRAHFIGAISPKDNPDHYLKCALDLLEHYKVVSSQHPSCPLIVNCSGWIQGSGLEVLIEIILRMAFTAIVYISQLGATEVVESLVSAANKAGIPFHTLSSQPSEIVTRTPSDLRMMQTLSYFHLEEPEGSHLRWDPSPISGIAPLVVRYAGVHQDIFAIMILGETQDPDNLSCILEGSVVGLVAIENDSAITIDKEEGIQSDDDDKDSTTQTEESVVGNADAEHPHAEPDHPQGMGFTDENPSDQPSPANLNTNASPLLSSSPKQSKSPSTNSSTINPSTTHLTHPSVLRNIENLPYLSSSNRTQPPLPPGTSHSLGQALIRSIDPTTQTLHLITPISPTTLQRLHAQKTKIVLTRGTGLDPPHWAYKEDLVLAAARRRRRLKAHGFAERFGVMEMRAWAEGVPWADVVDGLEGKSWGGKVWKARRDLKGKGEGEGEGEAEGEGEGGGGDERGRKGVRAGKDE